MSPINIYTPEKRSKIGTYNSEFIYSLTGSYVGGEFDSVKLLQNFNTQWSNLQSGGNWSVLSNSSGLFINQSLDDKYSKFISEGTNWPRNLDITTFIILSSSNDSINMFLCVQDTSKYYRINIKRTINQISIAIYKKDGTEVLLNSESFSLTWNEDNTFRVNCIISPTKISIFLGSTDFNFNDYKLEILDSSIEYGSFGIGSEDTSFSFKGPYIRTSSLDSDGLILRLSYCNKTSNDSSLPMLFNIKDKTIPFDIILTSGVEFNWNRFLVKNVISLTKLSSITNSPAKLIFKNSSLRNYTIYNRVFQQGSATNGTNGVIFDHLDKDNYSYIYHSDNDLNVYRISNSIESLILSIGAPYGTSYLEFTDWQYIITDTLFEVSRNGIILYSNKPSNWRKSIGWKAIGGKVGLISHLNGTGWDEFEIHEYGDQLLLDLKFNDTEYYDGTELASHGATYPVVENRNIIGTALFLNNSNSEYNILYSNKNIQSIKNKKIKVDLYYVGSEVGLYLNFGEFPSIGFTVSSSSEVFIFQSNTEYGIRDVVHFTSNTGSYLNEWTNLEVEILNTYIKFYINDILIYGILSSSIISDGNFAIYSPKHISDNTAIKNLEIFDIGREVIDSGEITNINEAIKSKGSLEIKSGEIINSKASTKLKQEKEITSLGLIKRLFQKEIDTEGRIKITWITATPEIFDPEPSNWDLFEVRDDIITKGSTKLSYEDTINSTARTKKPASSSINSNSNLKIAFQKNINSDGSVSIFNAIFIKNTVKSRGDWTNISSQTFYSILSDLSVSYYKYKVTTDLNDTSFDQENWDGNNITVNIGPDNKIWYFISYAYNLSNILIGKDIFWLNYDTISPIVEGAYILENPIYEDQDVNIIASEISDINIILLYEIFVNGVLYKSQTTNGITSSLFTDNNFQTGDKIDVSITASDEAGNQTSSSYAGYNYGGDETGKGPNDYIVIKRFYYNIFIWQGTFTEEDLNSKYCPNFNLELQKSFDCPVYESGMMFLPNTYKNCPYCHYPMTLGNYTPEKNIFETNLPPKTPIKESESDDLPILKFAINYSFKDQAKSWFYSLESRELPYGQDAINLGSFVSNSTNKDIHFEIQISKVSNFLDENIIHSTDSFDESSEFEYFSNSTGGWISISTKGLKNLNSATMRFMIPIKLEFNKTFYYRWRIIEYKDGARDYKEWLPSPSGISNFQIQKFSTPTEIWNGEYREHLLKDNFGYNGFYNINDIIRTYRKGIVFGLEYNEGVRLQKEQNTGDNVFLAISATEEILDNDIQNCIMQIKVRSDSFAKLNPFIVLEGQYEKTITDIEIKLKPNKEWQVFKVDLSESTSWKTLINKISVGFVSNLSEFEQGSYIDVDYIALLKKNPTYNKRYFYPHVISNITRCMFEQKQDGVDVYKTSGFCKKNHTAGIVWKGEWSILSHYNFQEGVINGGHKYASLKEIPEGTEIIDTNSWELLDDNTPMDNDGLYQGGSVSQNPQTTGYCKNTLCPDYLGLEKIDEYVEINYDENVPDLIQSIESFNPNNYNGLLFCPNYRLKEDGSPECRNHFYNIPIPASRKICTRNEGIRINNWRFGYTCEKFSKTVKESQFDTTGENAEVSNGISKLPASIEKYYDIVDGIYVERYYYEKIQPDHFYWKYENEITHCDGYLRGEDGQLTSEICDYPLVGFSEYQLCTDCGTPLVSLNMINSNVQLLKCSNNNKTIKMIPECNKGTEHTPFSQDIINCPESGDLLGRFLPTPLLEFNSIDRQLILEGEELELVADGLPKTWAYRGWDILLQMPYSGEIGGVSSPFVYGDKWQGVTNIKWLKATEDEIIDWQSKIQINSNLVNRMSNEIVNIDSYKDLHIEDQWKRNISQGDHKSLYRKPGTYVNYYEFGFETGEIYFSNASIQDNKIRIQTFSENETSLVRTRDIVNPKFLGDEYFGINISFNMNTVNSIVNDKEVFEIGLSSLLSEIVSIKNNEVSLIDKVEIKQYFLFKKRISGSNNFIDVFACNEDSVYNKSQLLISIDINSLPSNKNITIDMKYFTSTLIFDIKCNNQSSSYSLNIGPSSVQVAEKYTIYCLLKDQNIFLDLESIKFYQPEAEKSGYFGSNQDYIDMEILLSKPGLSIINEMDQFRLNSGESGYYSADKYTETYFRIEFDSKPTFDSYRGYPMRSIIGKGYTCLNKTLDESVSSPDGFSGATFCEKYKFVWSKEDAIKLNFKCPSCNNKLFLNRLDSALLSLTSTDKENRTPNLLPKIIYQLLNEELPGLNSEDFIENNLSIENRFFESNSENPKIIPDNWTEKKAASFIDMGSNSSSGYRKDDWFLCVDFNNWTTINLNQNLIMKDFSNDLVIFEQNTLKQSIYADREYIKEGNLIEQKIKTKFGPATGSDPITGYNTGDNLQRSEDMSGFYSIALCQNVDLSSLSNIKKEEIFGDIRLSAFFPLAGYHWSDTENKYYSDETSFQQKNSSRKVASVQFDLKDSNDNSIGIFHIILADTLYDYLDFSNIEYSYPSKVWVKFNRSQNQDDKDIWNFYKFNVYELLSSPLTSVSKSWTDVKSIEIRLCTTIIRDQNDYTYKEFVGDPVRNNQVNEAPNFAVTIWGHCMQGYDSILKEEDSNKLKYPPTYWDGTYYYRIIPYSFKLNIQWFNWYVSKANGWGIGYKPERWLMEDLVNKGGISPNKWMYRENKSLLSGKFNYSYQWNTVYNGMEHVIVPKGLE